MTSKFSHHVPKSLDSFRVDLTSGTVNSGKYLTPIHFRSMRAKGWIKYSLLVAKQICIRALHRVQLWPAKSQLQPIAKMCVCFILLYGLQTAHWFPCLSHPALPTYSIASGKYHWLCDHTLLGPWHIRPTVVHQPISGHQWALRGEFFQWEFIFSIILTPHECAVQHPQLMFGLWPCISFPISLYSNFQQDWELTAILAALWGCT